VVNACQQELLREFDAINDKSSGRQNPHAKSLRFLFIDSAYM